MSVILRGKKTLLQRALAILRRPDITAHAYIPGASGVSVSGLPTNNYLLSDGSTGFSSTDSVVGLDLDGMGSLGSELVTNGTFTTDITGWSVSASFVAGTISWSAGALLLTKDATAASYFGGSQAITTVIGLTYVITFTKGGSSPTSLGLHAGTTNSGSQYLSVASQGSGAGTYRYSFVATSTTAYLTPLLGTAANITGTFDDISCKPYTGVDLTQATSANKPLVRRGMYNLLTYSNDLTNAAWSKVNATAPASASLAPDGTTCFELTDDATNADHKMRQVVTVAAGTVVTFAAVAKVGTAGYMWLYEGYANSGKIFNLAAQSGLTAIGTAPTAFSTADMGNGWAMYTITYTTSTSTRPEIGMSLNGVTINYVGTGSTILVDAAGLFTGSLTASQILAQGGIPVTTTAAASNPNAGSYSWSFDGSNDSLALGSTPFQMADDHCVIAGVKQLVAANGYVFSQNNTAATTLVGAVAVTSGGFARALWSDDGGATAYLTGTAPILGTSTVVTAVKQGNAKRLRVNGVQDGATNNTAMGATTLNTASIGSYTTAGNINAQIGPVIVIKGTVSDADILALERLVGQLMGITI